ncbi:hypothetical protein B0H14DRAFT_3458594 [Mycena olivaceomarginata]|nr:hypothetical protein B0H14DRAFT_3458594 [Mycena olivaceomarginata]
MVMRMRMYLRWVAVCDACPQAGLGVWTPTLTLEDAREGHGGDGVEVEEEEGALWTARKAKRAVTSLLPAQQIPGCGNTHLSLAMSPRQHLPFPAPTALSAPSALPLPSHPASTSAPHSSCTPVPPRIYTAAAPSSRALPCLSCPVVPLCSRCAPVLPHNLVPCAPNDARTIHTKAAQIDQGILASPRPNACLVVVERCTLSHSPCPNSTHHTYRHALSTLAHHRHPPRHPLHLTSPLCTAV